MPIIGMPSATKALELLDDAVKSKGATIIGATNRPDDIDEALKRVLAETPEDHASHCCAVS